MADNGNYFETLGVLIASFAFFAGGVAAIGLVLTVLLSGIGVVFLGLWVGQYLMQGIAEGYNQSI